MILSDPTAGLLSPTLAKLLRALVSESTPRPGREISRIAGVSSAQGNTLLRRLTQLGIALETEQPPAKLYEINHSHLLVPQLRAILRTLDSIVEELREELVRLPTIPAIAVLFGSVMRQEDHQESDLDLYLVFDDSVTLDKGQLLESTAALSEGFLDRTGNSLNVMVQKMSDLRNNFVARSKFLENLLLDGKAVQGWDVLNQLKEEYQWSITPHGQSN
jgi:predicted nucleotidyltransferase